MRIDLQIGGYVIRLREREDCQCLHWPLPPFDSFLIQPEHSPDIDLDIRVTDDLPEIPRGPLIFDASHGLWKLHETESGFLLDSPDTSSLQPRSRAVVSADFSHAVVWHRKEHGSAGAAWTPMHVITPVLEVCLASRVAREGGLMLHASGVLTERGAWVFTGPSGAGKSTLADLFASRGARVLCDERMIIRKLGNELGAFGTPWVGSGRWAANAAGPLAGLYGIRHGKDAHSLRTLTPREFATAVLRQCFLPHWDPLAMERTLAFLDTLIGRTGCRELAFLNQTDIVDYLMAQRVERQLATT